MVKRIVIVQYEQMVVREMTRVGQPVAMYASAGAGAVRCGVIAPNEPYFFFSSRGGHTRFSRDWSSDVCSSDLCGCEGVDRHAHGLQLETRDLLIEVDG